MAKGASDDTAKGAMTCAEAGAKGGKRTAERHGTEFYEKIGRKGGQRVKRLIQQGQEAERAEGERDE